MASRGAVRTPLPKRSTKRAARTWPQDPDSASSGRLAADTPYPRTISSLRRRKRSASHPEPNFTVLAVVSAIPSISPMTALSTPSTADRKSGTSG